jgi:hypothetical protein
LGLLKVGQEFKVVDWYTESAPILKIYLPQAQYTQKDCYDLYKKTVVPLLPDPKMAKCNSVNTNLSYKIYLFEKLPCYENLDRGEKMPIENVSPSSIVSVINQPYYFVYLPISIELISALKQKALKDQNIVFVKTPDEADASLYCSLNSSNNFVFTISDEINNRKYPHSHFPSKFQIEMTDKEFEHYSMDRLANDLYDKVLLVNASHKRLLNFYSRR